ncbi:MAG: helix-turn-helix domain-containing protein [Xenococcaceae cyanobacterium]
MLRWRLKEVMARHNIKGYLLAKEMEIRAESVSYLRSAKKMPKLDSDRIEKLCRALGKLAGVKIRFADLYEEIDSDSVMSQGSDCAPRTGG